jgi:D-alanyl-D-alanine dipeptidase
MEAEGFSVYENEWWHFDYHGWEEWPVLDVSLESAPVVSR